MKITKRQLRQIIREEVNRTRSHYQRLSEASASQAELNQILTDHRLWLESDGKRGKRADLQGANLQGADLQDADLLGADLQGADLREAYLRGANLRGANLVGTHLVGAILFEADLQGASLPISIDEVWSFRHAKFSADALPKLAQHPSWPKWKNTVQIVH